MNLRNKILRIVDANTNRAKEGLRVCEDIMRLIVDDKKETLALKKIRHDVSNILKNSKIKQSEIIKHRDSCSDIGKTITIKNSKKAVLDIFMANAQRVKEAIRVMEEIFCILDKKTSDKLQNLRFKFYGTEKESINRLRNYLSQK
jgi:thiamine-phosphate pyrophosphorylase